MLLVEVRGIGRRAPGTTSWLLQDVSLAISGGDRLALVGPAGCGKTLLLRALAQLDPVDAGEVLWRGESLAPAAIPAYRSQVTYLHQRSALLAGTVEENLKWPFTLGIFHARRFDRERVLRYLAVVDRDASFLDKSDRDLSGGERQIVALLRAVQLDPVVLLLDEPTSALDGETRDAVESLVRDWQRQMPQERALLWVTHDAEQAARVSERVLSMRDGRLIKEP
jgi:putative ABC transport system ATP-binding protein